MEHVLDKWEAYLTNGEVCAEIIPCKDKAAICPPDGVIYGEDNKGNMYLDGKPAWVAYRHTRIDFGKV